MTVSARRRRQDELIDALFELGDAEFDAWLERQPDRDELAREGLDLMRSEPRLGQLERARVQRG